MVLIDIDNNAEHNDLAPEPVPIALGRGQRALAQPGPRAQPVLAQAAPARAAPARNAEAPRAPPPPA